MFRLKISVYLLVAFVIALYACDDGDSHVVDGDSEAADGDAETTDGDEPDGDEPDGDEPDGDDSWSYPDPSFIYQAPAPSYSIADESYTEEKPEQFDKVERLANLDVRSLVHLESSIWAGTAEGLYRKADGESEFFEVDLPDTDVVAPIVDIARNTFEGKIAVAFDYWLYLVDADGSSYRDVPFESGIINSVAVSEDGSAMALGSDDIWSYGPDVWTKIEVPEDIEIRDLAIDKDGVILAATNKGVLRFGGDSTPWNLASGDLSDDDVRSIAVCGEKVAIATATGIAIREGGVSSLYVGEVGGMPTDDNLVIDCQGDDILVGHGIGGTFVKDDFSHVDHYVSKRWIPDNRVSSVALGADGERWLGGSAGLSRIYLIERSLADKERVMHDMIQNFLRMDGVAGAFVSSDGRLAEPENDLSTMSLGDKDNDGLWTQMMIGGWCFAYDQTGEEEYYDLARLAMNNMEMLVDLPAATYEAAGLGRGFISRSLIRDDEGAIYDNRVAEQEKVDDKDILRWNPVTYGDHDYLFKADTSSDEIAGHFFGFPVYFDLCAKDEAERAEVADRAVAVADYILRHGFLLLDYDGTKTTHGHWAPDWISISVDGSGPCIDAGYDIMRCFEAEAGGGWLNSLQILGVLLSAYHMSGEQKFYDAYETLIREHRYDEVAMANNMTLTITNRNAANHSDHELAMLAYTTLIRYEPNDERRAKWLESLTFLYDHERPESNPWWAAVYAMSGGADPDVEGAVATLREIPDDRREWHIDNLHRKDAEEIGLDRHGDRQLDTVFPYDELRTAWWNMNPYCAIDGGDGRGLSAPTAWLLPYYMCRYAGLIQ